LAYRFLHVISVWHPALISCLTAVGEQLTVVAIKGLQFTNPVYTILSLVMIPWIKPFAAQKGVNIMDRDVERYCHSPIEVVSLVKVEGL
jgi:hypothetical protein